MLTKFVRVSSGLIFSGVGEVIGADLCGGGHWDDDMNGVGACASAGWREI